jgi:hypothetical protein
VLESFAAFGSGGDWLVTIAVVEAWPSRWARTLISSVALWPLASCPRSQFTRFDPCRSHVPCEGVAETKSTSFASVVSTVTPLAASAPPLATPIV